MGVPGISVGGLGWSDAPNHTFDGIFILEYFRHCASEGRLILEGSELRAWAEQFYIRYPSLGIVVYWPPGFAVVEAAVFAVFGVSIVAARATVLAFAVGAGLLMYALGRRWFDRPSGLLASLLLITCPHGVWWLNDVMLEWPATFWILAAVWAYQRGCETGRRRWAVLLGGCLAAAFLTKQTAAFIGPVLVIHALLDNGRRSYLRRPASISSLCAAAAVIGGYWYATRGQAALAPQLLQLTPDWLFYPRHLPEILGLPLLPIALLGLLTFILLPDRRARGLLLLWFFGWGVFSSLIAAKEPRYFFFAVPPLCFAAVRMFMRSGVDACAGEGPRERRSHRGTDSRRCGCEKSRRTSGSHQWVTAGVGARSPDVRRDRTSKTARRESRPPETARVVLLGALVVAQTALAMVKSTGRLPTYAGAVEELTRRADADLVLVDAVRDGQFVFDVYQDATAQGRLIPLRASKLLYARAARMQYDGRLFVEREGDVLRYLDQYGIRYIVIESALPRTHDTDADPPPRKLLRNLLATDPRFTLVQSWPLRCDDPVWDDVELRLYAYPTCPPRASKEITLSFPGMGRDVTFQLP